MIGIASFTLSLLALLAGVLGLFASSAGNWRGSAAWWAGAFIFKTLESLTVKLQTKVAEGEK